MDIVGFVLRKPVTVTVGVILLVLFGLIGLRSIPVQLVPDVDRPVITILTNYDGATPETVDKEVTSIVESAVARAPGVASISSSSRSGQSRITVEFNESADMPCVSIQATSWSNGPTSGRINSIGPAKFFNRIIRLQ